jgi:DNA-directed RNA polymerase specialized sigma24 family protein
MLPYLSKWMKKLEKRNEHPSNQAWRNETNDFRTSELKQQLLEWRRAQILELASEQYTQREIAHKLQVDLTAVNRDIQFL